MNALTDGRGERLIRAVAEKALQKAGVIGTFPTPLNLVAGAGGIRETLDIDQLPSVIRPRKPSLLRRLLGAYVFRAETAFVDFNQATPRARFTQAHEIGHKIIPWHEGSYYLDDDEKLFRETEDGLERDANLAATLLLFQGHRFHEQALDYEVSIRTPIRLSEKFGASKHATIRYYTEYHPDPVALAVAGRMVDAEGNLPVWHATESREFRRRYGPLAALFPTTGLKLDGPHASPLAPAAHAAFSAVDSTLHVVELEGLAERGKRFNLEGFFNQHCLFLMLSSRRAVRTGRRLRLISRS